MLLGSARLSAGGANASAVSASLVASRSSNFQATRKSATWQTWPSQPFHSIRRLTLMGRTAPHSATPRARPEVAGRPIPPRLQSRGPLRFTPASCAPLDAGITDAAGLLRSVGCAAPSPTGQAKALPAVPALRAPGVPARPTPRVLRSAPASLHSDREPPGRCAASLRSPNPSANQLGFNSSMFRNLLISPANLNSMIFHQKICHGFATNPVSDLFSPHLFAFCFSF